jgi:hypothetical protein
MCLLIHQSLNHRFTDEQLADFYSKNSDGFGAIVNQPDGVRIVKTVGNLQEIQALYESQVAGHEAVIHFRMQTHGDIDLVNCHPYQVTDEIYMAHNGILSTGNAADLSKSDTWHYIENYLKPLLSRYPSILHEQSFQKMLGSHIGMSNKFAFMDAHGKVVVINKQAGVEHFNCWLSNTYAWTPTRWGYSTGYEYGAWAKGANVYGGTTYNPSKQLTFTDTNSTKTTKGGKATTKKPAKSYKKKKVATITRLSSQALGRIIQSCYNAYQRNHYYGLVDWVLTQPMMAINLLHEFYKGQLSTTDIETIVNSNPEEAADWIEMCWNDCEEDMLAIAGIAFEPKKKGMNHDYVGF